VVVMVVVVVVGCSIREPKYKNDPPVLANKQGSLPRRAPRHSATT
jgi:hypothetical protein